MNQTNNYHFYECTSYWCDNQSAFNTMESIERWTCSIWEGNTCTAVGQLQTTNIQISRKCYWLSQTEVQSQIRSILHTSECQALPTGSLPREWVNCNPQWKAKCVNHHLAFVLTNVVHFNHGHITITPVQLVANPVHRQRNWTKADNKRGINLL